MPDDVSTLPGERPDQLVPGMPAAAGAGADQGDRLPIELAGSDDPIERILQRTGHAGGVFRRGDHDGVGLADR